MNKLKLPLIYASLILMLFSGCAKEELPDNILGLWKIRKLTYFVESATEPVTTFRASPFDNIGRIFFGSTGNGALQIYYDRYPEFDELVVGVTPFTWVFEDGILLIDNAEAKVLEESWRKMTLETIEITGNNRRLRTLYELSR